jgi:hypothetical protein
MVRMNGLKLSQCETRYKCLECDLNLQRFDKDGDALEHKCGYAECKNCGEVKEVDHPCFVQQVKLKDPNEKII